MAAMLLNKKKIRIKCTIVAAEDLLDFKASNSCITTQGMTRTGRPKSVEKINKTFKIRHTLQ